MRLRKIALVANALYFGGLVAPNARADLIPSADGTTVYDTVTHVTWLANANLAATQDFGVAGIYPNGAMSYATAVAWVAAMNAFNGGAGYLGHNDWTLPTTPLDDSTCTLVGPNGSFGYSCMNSTLGSLYSSPSSLGLNYPDTSVLIPPSTFGPFMNFQPYLYWSDTSIGSGNGYHTFSFNTGWDGGNLEPHYMYALPMLQGQVSATYHAAGMGTLEVSADGTLVYDPIADVTWLADANLALSRTFGAQCVRPDGRPCIDTDGSMSHDTAENWIAGMNDFNGGAGWLSQTTWQLPPNLDGDDACYPGFGCDASPMGELFYDQMGLPPGTAVTPTPDISVGPFNNLQPYLYWSCEGDFGTRAPCYVDGPTTGFEYSFSFGNGFEGTDLVANGLYVMVYYPDQIFVNGFELE